MKKVVILKTNQGRLANQLWNYASIFAYAAERKVTCDNPAFFRYAYLFESVSSAWWSFSMKNTFISNIARVVYELYARIVCALHKEKVLTASEDFELPPTTNTNVKQMERLAEVEMQDTIYMNGWLFRNTEGLKKFHKEITTLLTPKQIYRVYGDELMAKLRTNAMHIIGVHIRQGDYRVWEGGVHYVSPEHAKEKMLAYIQTHEHLTKENTCFVVCSDENISSDIFSGINVVIASKTPVEDLCTLSKTDAIIGSHSTFGPWAAYYGDISFTEFSAV